MQSLQKKCRQSRKSLSKFSAELADKPRWLVINKTDLAELRKTWSLRKRCCSRNWTGTGQYFEVSAATGAGTEALGHAVMQALEEIEEEEEAGAGLRQRAF